MKAIIPCAGFGTRMNVDVNTSKELLPDNVFGEPLIAWTLRQCYYCDIEPLILVRKEKADLIDYCKQNKIQCVVMKPGKEWAETVYNSRQLWADKNILILPDTRFQPTSVLRDIDKLLDFGSEIVFGVHEVDDISKWGYVDSETYCEKPQLNIKGHAWGVIGFRQYGGEQLFRNMQDKNQYYDHENYTNFIILDEFKDLTRTGKIE